MILAATLGANYGIYSGFELYENVPVRDGSEEYLDSEKYELKTWPLDRRDSLRPLLTRAQLRYDELMGSEGWGSVRALRAGAVASSEFVKVFDNGDAQIFKLRERGK